MAHNSHRLDIFPVFKRLQTVSDVHDRNGYSPLEGKTALIQYFYNKYLILNPHIVLGVRGTRVSKEKFCPRGTYRHSTHEDSNYDSCEKGYAREAGATRACGWRANPRLLGSWKASGRKSS